MKAITLLTLVAGMACSLQASETGENRNLFKTAGPKQTNEDFKPAPEKIIPDRRDRAKGV